MNTQSIKHNIEIIANVGVLLGIILLAYEVNQNNQLLTSQTSFNQFDIERERQLRISENLGGITEIILKDRGGNPLTDIEATQLLSFRSHIINGWKWQFREVEAGRLPEEFIDVFAWRRIWGLNPGVQEVFEAEKSTLGQSFVTFFEENVISQLEE